MTNTSGFRLLSAAVVCTAVLTIAAPAGAEEIDCARYRFWTKTFPWLSDRTRCIPVYEGDYMVDRGPFYSGPAVMAPQPTYAPAPTADSYPYVYTRWSVRTPVYAPVSYRAEERPAPPPKIKAPVPLRPPESVPQRSPEIAPPSEDRRIFGPIGEPPRQ